MISDFLNECKPDIVFLDAPLSLPKAYFGKGEDFFYRKGDKKIGAMSPMFLGGLTARAIKLKTHFEKMGITFLEAYPGGLAKEWELGLFGYKKEKDHLEKVTEEVLTHLQLDMVKLPTTWHEVDALLAYAIGKRYQVKEAHFFGDEKEGGIWV